MRLKSHVLVLAVALASFALTAMTIPLQIWPTTAALSLGCGVAALSMMAVAALLSARWQWIESLLGGLDRVYQAHKWLAVWALVLASFHLVFSAELDDWQTSAIIALPRAVIRLLRQLSFVALMVIVLLALNRRIPYSHWRWWHKLSGPLFLIAILHWLSFRSPITLGSPPGVWLAVLAGLGTLAALYRLVLYPRWSPHARYRVATLSSSATALHLELAPEAGRVDFEPGQFAFLSFDEPGLRDRIRSPSWAAAAVTVRLASSCDRWAITRPGCCAAPGPA